jgi:hypothetical protein
LASKDGGSSIDAACFTEEPNVLKDNPEQDAAVVAVIAAFMRDADRMADLAATYLKHLGISQRSWNAAFLLELGAVLRIRQWETAGIKDAVDPTLPSFQTALADLTHRLRSEPERFIRGEAPLLQRVLTAWWFRCAHPNNPVLEVDVVLSGVERSQLISCAAQLLWKLRNVQSSSFDQS